MSLGFALDVTLRGLMSTSSKIQVVSQNITNADKAGYTRKEATDTYLTTNAGTVPFKINITGSTDNYLTKSLVGDVGTMGKNKAISELLEYYSSQLGATDGSNTMSSELNDLYGALQQLSVSPETLANKTEAVQIASNLADSLRNLSGDIQELRIQADQKISDNVTTVNNTVQQLYQINQNINSGNLSDSQMAEYMDQRAAALQTLAQSMDIQYYVTSSNQLQIFTGGGQPLLLSQAFPISYAPTTNVNSGTVFQPIMLNGVDITNQIANGELAGNIEIRDKTLVDEQAKLDQFATVLKTQMNTLLNKGSSLPPQTTLTGSLTGLTGTSAISGTGTLRVAIVNNSGVLQNYADINLSTITDVNGLLTALNAIPNMSASLNASGSLVMTSTLSGSGVALNEMNSSIGGAGASSYFGMQDFFTGTSAATLNVSSSLLANPNFLSTGALSSGTIAAGDNVITRGDGSTALAMAQIIKTNVPFSAAGNFSAQSNTLSRYIEAFMADGSTKASLADSQYEAANAVYTQTKATLENKSGVNVDEETSKMLELQNAYQTSAKMISTIRDMFDALLAAIR